jgi:hypothetical protein
MLFTLVEPHRGHEVAYHRWYERDHFYAGCMIGPWLFAGRRWVATRPLKDLRFPADGPIADPVDAGSYLATYWVEAGQHDAHFEWAGKQVHWLYDHGRGFAERSHVHTGLYDYVGAVYRDSDPVPVELALDHAYAGLAAVFLQRAGGGGEADLDDWLLDEALPKHMAGTPLASCTHWRPHPTEGGPTETAPMKLGTSPGGAERRLQLLFLEREPAACMDALRAYAEQVDASGLARVLLVAQFIPTVVGTDTYTDQLW